MGKGLVITAGGTVFCIKYDMPEFPVAPEITSTAVTDAEQNQAYTYDVVAVGDNTPLVYSLDTYPTGMTINSSTGAISWTPSATGTENVVVRVTDSQDQYDTQSFTITVAAPPSLAITSTAVTSAVTDQAYSYTVVGAYGTPPYTYSLDTKPTGMTIGSSSGVISWTPTESDEGDNSVVVRVTDDDSNTTTQSYTLNVTGDPYAWFSSFAESNFNSESTLEDAHTGGVQSVPAASIWTHGSLTSIAIGFRTVERTKCWIAISGTPVTDTDERATFVHLHHVTGLSADTSYDLQIYDATGLLHTETVSTVTPGAYTAVSTGEQLLRTSGMTYILTQDITVDTFGFKIKSSNITLDLNGYTLTYDNGTPLVSGTTWNNYIYSNDSSMGVHWFWSGARNAKVVNGTIKQGANAGTGDIGNGFNPICCAGSAGAEVAGIIADYTGDDISGILFKDTNTQDANIHHNVIKDRGTVTPNRHAGNHAITGPTNLTNTSYACHDNLILRCRHMGISIDADVTNNEVWGDSWVTNSFLLNAQSSDCTNNYAFGTGQALIALAYGNNVTNNFVYFEVSYMERDTEYPGTSAWGYRMTQLADSPKVYTDTIISDNTIILAGDGTNVKLRGTGISHHRDITGTIVRDNVIKVTNNSTESTSTVACIVVHGLSDAFDGGGADNAPVTLYEDNTLTSDQACICFGDNYGGGSNGRFVGNEFIRIATAYFDVVETILTTWDSKYHDILNSTLTNGADLLVANFNDFNQTTTTREYYVGTTDGETDTLTHRVNAEPGDTELQVDVL